MEKQIEDLKKQIETLNIDEILRRDVKTFGSAGHIVIPLKHVNKKVLIIVLNDILPYPKG